MEHTKLEFPITIYGNFEKVNDTISKARVRIFYKYGNRNGTYITDEFADKLIQTLPYTPVKGIFSYEDVDYTDHGASRQEGRIYGIVPNEPNFAWEPHIDEDGVKRIYACSDVYLFTALYPEAEIINGKSQSMELYEKTLKYHFAIIDGQKWAVFDSGSFLGLQVLGNNVEPCFEGAAFYSLEDIEKTVKLIEEAISRVNAFSVGGKSEMHNVLNFKLSDSQKHDMLWHLVNPNYTEEGDWIIDTAVCEIYDDYAITYNYETGKYARAYYTKSNETDSIEITKMVEVFIIDVTEAEKKTLDALRALNGDTYELVDENLTNAKENAEKCVEFNTKIEESENTIATLNTKIETADSTIADLTQEKANFELQISNLSEEVESLKAYKKSIEDQSKEAVIAEYTDKLSAEVLETYKGKLDEYTAEDLDMRLAYECKKTGVFSFSSDPNPGRLPKDSPREGIEEILSRYTR